MRLGLFILNKINEDIMSNRIISWIISVITIMCLVLCVFFVVEDNYKTAIQYLVLAFVLQTILLAIINNKSKE